MALAMLSRLTYLDRGYVTLPTANYCARSYKSVATQQSITHVIYSLYPCPILGQPKSESTSARKSQKCYYNSQDQSPRVLYILVSDSAQRGEHFGPVRALYPPL